MIDESKQCDNCKGKKIVKENKTLKVEIDKGAPHGEQYTIHGEGDEVPDLEPGDVIVQILEKPHKNFRRRGGDLLMEKEISLLEALTGLSFVLKHLDGRKIRVDSEAGDIIKPDDFKTIDGLGMPFHKKSYVFGNMFIHFKIRFPTSIDPSCHSLLANVLKDEKKVEM